MSTVALYHGFGVRGYRQEKMEDSQIASTSLIDCC